MEVGQELAGLIIYKDETHQDAGTKHPGPRILKVCTFKLKPEYRGEKFGEQLLKQVLWFAQRNKYDLVYVTAFPTQIVLINLLVEFGFEPTHRKSDGELFLEKEIVQGPLARPEALGTLEFDRHIYPRLWDGNDVRKFCVPIRGPYHQKLFPEISFERVLPLFPEEPRRLLGIGGRDRVPGNTIRKVYLCRAPSQQISEGDLICFYMSKDSRLSGSQSVTTIGVVEQISHSRSVDELIRMTARRSVYSAEELKAMQEESSTPVKVIDFLLLGHSDPFVSLATLLEEGIFYNHPPRSICQLTARQYASLKRHLSLGHDI